MQVLFFEGKPGYLVMLLRAYLDESSDQHQARAFVAAGFAGAVKSWTDLRRPWKKKLLEHRIHYFNSSECRNLQGEFWKYKNELGLEKGKQKALQIRSELEAIIDKGSIIGFALGTNMADFKKVNSSPEARFSSLWNPDYEDATFQLLIHGLVTRLKSEFIGNSYQIGFIHDESSKSAKLKASYDCFKKRHPHLSESMRSFTSLDDKKQPPLQMADLMADVARDMIARKIDDPTLNIIPRSGVNGAVYTVDCWQMEGMLRILRGQTKTLNISPCLDSTGV